MTLQQICSKAAVLAAVTVAAGFFGPLTQAQQTAPPPELQTLDEGEPPAVAIKKPGAEPSRGNSITERREHGQTKQIRVQSGPSTYYLTPKKELGSSMPGDTQSGPPTSAQWQVKEFDWSEKKPPNEGENAPSSAK